MTVDSPESKDRAWLCKLLVVLALAESVDVGRQPEITLNLYDPISRPLSQNISSQYVPIPGQEFFEQALMILKISYENTTVDHVEILNLIALYSNQLNRQKAAYNYAGASARICNTLQLHKVSASIDCSSAEREHRKRLWWSTYCLDRMTSTFTGLPPALEVDQTDLAYPKQPEDSPDDAEEFSDADFLTARIQLTIIQTRNLKSVSHIGLDDAQDIKTVLRPNLRRLESWRESLPAHMISETGNDTNEPTKSLPSKRSLANMHLRFNHCIILLLRPLILRQVACIFSNEKSNAAQEDLEYINNNCLKSARSNVLIMINVRSAGLITRLGFMENMHLFTSLMILCLAMSVNARRPGSFKETPNDIKTYQAGKNVLSYMMTCGSFAAKGNLNMLKEVEDLGITIATESGGVDADEGNQWDIEEWVTQLFESEDMLGSCGLHNSA
ncbi:unnamed protein product [Clonostachys solani]|uniref:Xylanolytic transcriptional activator regulatory domain-containing protein n=1 Tax=Clonostachys solani TaxID=160281 RepID=A0A9P0EKY5_9HYPO|nr:unnamed protein product [Clonostachys solani]